MNRLEAVEWLRRVAAAVKWFAAGRHYPGWPECDSWSHGFHMQSCVQVVHCYSHLRPFSYRSTCPIGGRVPRRSAARVRGQVRRGPGRRVRRTCPSGARLLCPDNNTAVRASVQEPWSVHDLPITSALTHTTHCVCSSYMYIVHVATHASTTTSTTARMRAEA